MPNLNRKEALPAYVRVRRSTRARRLALRLDSKERVFDLVVPSGMSLKKAHAFAEDNDNWIQEKLQDLPKQVLFCDGARIPVLGRARIIDVRYDKNSRTTSIELKQNKILVLTNKKDPAQRIERWLRELAREELTALSHKKAAKLGKSIAAITIRDTKSRWGSCSEDDRISYSWRLILAPYEAMDYVVAHEVAHLQHLDHSPAFWSQCRKLSENYMEGKYWMAEYAHELMRYG